jgi:acetyl esterase/lipase
MIQSVRDPREVLGRKASPPDAVIRYGDRPEQMADLRLPRRISGPLVILLHGGFWRREYDKVHVRPMADGLVRAGYAVATPEYARTGAGGGWPSTFDDVALAVSRLPTLIARAAAGAGPLLLVGHSAGGQLALWCAATGLPPVYAGVVALAPVADLAEAFRLDLDGGAVADLLGGSPDEVPDRYAATDPCVLPPPAIPVVLVHGTDDRQVPLDLSRRYAAHNPSAELRILEGAGHFGLIDPLATAWPAVIEAIRSVQDHARGGSRQA